MSLYGITGVRLNLQGRVTRAAIQPIDGSSNRCIGQPSEKDGHDIATLIAMGDVVYSIFIVEGGTVLGPQFRIAVYDHGVESVELKEGIEGRSLQDLVQIT